MKPSELFGVLVRTVGLVVTLSALGLIGLAILSAVMGGPESVLGLLIRGIPTLLVGLWLLSGAEWLVRLVYRSEG